VIVTTFAAVTIIWNVPVAVAAGLALSLTLTLKVYAPAVIGIPVNAPPLDRLIPAGKVEPLAKLHAYGWVPPLAVNVVSV
jgi:hypothetical protein